MRCPAALTLPRVCSVTARLAFVHPVPSTTHVAHLIIFILMQPSFWVTDVIEFLLWISGCSDPLRIIQFCLIRCIQVSVVIFLCAEVLYAHSSLWRLYWELCLSLFYHIISSVIRDRTFDVCAFYTHIAHLIILILMKLSFRVTDVIKSPLLDFGFAHPVPM